MIAAYLVLRVCTCIIISTDAPHVFREDDIAIHVDAYLDESLKRAQIYSRVEASYESFVRSSSTENVRPGVARPSDGKRGCEWTIAVNTDTLKQAANHSWRGRLNSGVGRVIQTNGNKGFRTFAVTPSDELLIDFVAKSGTSVARKAEPRKHQDSAYAISASRPLTSEFALGDPQFSFRQGLIDKTLVVDAVYRYQNLDRTQERLVFVVSVDDLSKLTLATGQRAPAQVRGVGEVHVDPKAGYAIVRSAIMASGTTDAREIRIRYKDTGGVRIPDLIQHGSSPTFHKSNIEKYKSFFEIVLTNQNDPNLTLPATVPFSVLQEFRLAENSVRVTSEPLPAFALADFSVAESFVRPKARSFLSTIEIAFFTILVVVASIGVGFKLFFGRPKI